MRRFRQLLTFAGLVALWFLYVGQFSVPEFVAGAVAALLTARFVALSQGGGPPVRLRWFVRAFGPTLRVFPETWTVMTAIVRALAGRGPSGRLVVIPAPAGEAPEDDARIGAHVLGISISPNTVVVDVPNGQRGYVVHQLVEAELPRLERLP